MLGLFGALDMGSHSLTVQQEAMSVAGQNMANVNNSAYAREQLNVQSSTPLQTSIGSEGTGITATSITEVRDGILDNQIQSEDSVNTSLTAQQNALQDAEASLSEQLSASSSSADGAAASTDGLAADLSSFFNAAQSLTTNPADLSTRQAFIQSAQQVANQFNQVSSGLSAVNSDLNSSISSDVSSANQYLSDIATLNQQIIYAQASGATANTLIDQRQQDIENLAGKVNLTTATQSDGAMNVTIGGVTMVSGATVQDSLQTVDPGNGNLLVKAQNAGTTLSITGGSIGGEIEARDGSLTDLQSNLNNLASQIISQVNLVYSPGFDLNGATAQNLFTGSDAASMGVNSALANDPTKLQVSRTAGANGDNTVALEIANLANQTLPGLNNQTITQSYTGTVANFGEALSSVNDQLNNSNTVSQMLTTQRDSVSGVSVDEESTNLIQFQKAYQASAELITTLNQMLETLITMKTV